MRTLVDACHRGLRWSAPYVLCCAVAGVAIGAAHATSAPPLLAQNWRDLSPKERYDALQNFRRYEQLPADRQRDMDQRYERWRQLPPEERARLRRNYERYRQMPPQEREQFDRKYEKWKRQREPRR